MLPTLALAAGMLFSQPTTTTLSPSANPIPAGTELTLTATVSPASATGTVNFIGLYTGHCGQQPIVSGIATCVASFPYAATFHMSARYNGDATYDPSQSTILNEAVTPSGSTPTTTTVTVGPNPAATGEPIMLIAHPSPAIAQGVVTFFVDGHALETDSAVIRVGTAFATVQGVPAGAHTVTATYLGDLNYSSSTSAPAALTVTAPTAFTQYFAEGATGNFFHTDLGLFNAGTGTAQVRVTAFPEDGGSRPLSPITLGPSKRQTIDLNSALGGQTGFSLLVESDQPVAATRQMTWGQPVYGSTLESGSPMPSLTWHFAEGATNTFSLFFLIENPNAAPATVTLTHLLEGGAPPVTETDIIPAFTRRTYNINDVPGLRSAALSTVVTSDIPIVAERAMYLNTSSRLWEGGTASLGARSLSAYWEFAEGATGSFFHTYLLLGNPNPGGTSVTVSYVGTAGTPLTKTYVVPGLSRRTIDVNNDDPKLAATSVGISVSADAPIVAERAMWWGDPWTDGSASLGSTRASATWAIGEGAEGGPASEATFVLVSYNNMFDSSFNMTVVYDDGTSDTKSYQIYSHTRVTIRVGDDFPNARNRRFSVLVHDTFDDALLVEIARYQSPTTFGDGGGAALATRIP